MMHYISAVIPVYNETESLPELHRQFTAVCEENEYRYEIVQHETRVKLVFWVFLHQHKI